MDLIKEEIVSDDIIGELELPMLDINDATTESWPTSPSCWICVSE